MARLVTYGTMAAKSSIRDTARVLDLSLNEADHIAKLLPNMKLSKIFSLDDEELRKSPFGRIYTSKRIQRHAEESDLQERHSTGQFWAHQHWIHACGVIITCRRHYTICTCSYGKRLELCDTV